MINEANLLPPLLSSSLHTQRYASLCRGSDVAGTMAKFPSERAAETRCVLKAEICCEIGDSAFILRIAQQVPNAQESLTLNVLSNTSRSFKQAIKLGSGNAEESAQCVGSQLP